MPPFLVCVILIGNPIMHSTPLTDIKPTYNDNPIANLSFLRRLSKEQTHIYTMGYIQACHHMLESLTESRTKFLEAALDLEGGPQARVLVLVKMLDMFDDTLQERLLLLQRLDSE